MRSMKSLNAIVKKIFQIPFKFLMLIDTIDTIDAMDTIDSSLNFSLIYSCYN